MCLAAFALQAHPRFPLVIAANRDEFFDRPAAPMACWRSGASHLLAGRDLQAGGSWFGLSRPGRLALLTNVREPSRQVAPPPSRGALVVDWLTSTASAPRFVSGLAAGYNGFNLVMGDVATGDWHWASNRAPGPVALAPGLHALSNASLDTPWPKTRGLQAAMDQALGAADTAPALAEQLMQALADASPAADADLPDTGVGLARERLLSPRFVRMPDPDRPHLARYGTRCSTVLVREAGGTTWVWERSVDAAGAWGKAVEHRLARWP